MFELALLTNKASYLLAVFNAWKKNLSSSYQAKYFPLKICSGLAMLEKLKYNYVKKDSLLVPAERTYWKG